MQAIIPDGPDISPHYRPNGQPDFTKRWTKHPPPPGPPTDEQLFLPGKSKPNAAFLRRHFYYEGRLHEHQALWILKEASRVLSKEPNVLSLTSPITICGDIHGQYYDLVRLMEPSLGGSASKTRYLFLGDYVDRGVFGIECLLLLYALKLNYPDNFLLLRGNHECRRLTDYFTFRLECRRKYSDALYEAAIESFNCLPLAAVVDNTLFCVHGGLSPSMTTIQDVQVLDRFQEPPTKGLMCDLLWSDPARDHSHEEIDYVENGQRGCSYYFGYKAIRRFLDVNRLTLVIRAHEVEQTGFKRFTTGGQRAHLMTIFSAPNYLDFYDNLGAVIVYEKGKMSVRQFKCTEHPYWLPNFSDAFTWSLPFVALKAADMLQAIMSVFPDEESDSEDETPTNDQMDIDPRLDSVEVGLPRRKHLKKDPKWRESQRMRKVFQVLREESEGASELSKIGPHPGYGEKLAAGGNDIRPGTPFQEVRRLDLVNERLPDEYLDYTHMLRRVGLPDTGSAPGSSHGTPRQQSQPTLYDEPEPYQDDGHSHPYQHQQYQQHQQHQQYQQYQQPQQYVTRPAGYISLVDREGHVKRNSPSLRRRSYEEQDELFRRIAMMQLSG
ncbi:Metallo-dependent phosphatase [Serendipita vermifera]|nr:Metallo-dependent phosphatase [Serendipita vermifera]